MIGYLMICSIGLVACLVPVNSKDDLQLDKQIPVILGGETGCYVTGTMTMEVYVSFHDNLTNEIKSFNDVITLPDASVSGNCSYNRAKIFVQSNDRKWVLAMSFQTKQTNSSEETWALSELKLTTRDQNSNSQIQLSKRGDLTGSGKMMFESPYNSSYHCKAKQRVVINSPTAHASLVFSQVRLQPFSEQLEKLKAKHRNGIVCPEDLNQGGSPLPKSEVFVPLVLAISLSVVALLVIMGYLFHRKVGGMGYVNMD